MTAILSVNKPKNPVRRFIITRSSLEQCNMIYATTISRDIQNVYIIFKKFDWTSVSKTVIVHPDDKSQPAKSRDI